MVRNATTTVWAPAVPVRLRAVGRVFGAAADARTVLSGIDLDVAAGEVVALLGASGCGKSTLLRLVAGLDRPSSGEVLVDGDPVDGIDPRAAVVFQEHRLLPWRSLAGNVALGLPDGITRADRRDQVAEALDAVGLADFARYRPRAVSGGMAQRAALARALVRRPGVLLLDEPFAALDALTRLRIQDLVADLQRVSGATVLLVTHDVDEALHLADRVAVLATGTDPSAGAAVAEVVEVPGERPTRPRRPGPDPTARPAARPARRPHPQSHPARPPDRPVETGDPDAPAPRHPPRRPVLPARGPRGARRLRER